MVLFEVNKATLFWLDCEIYFLDELSKKD